MKKIYHSSAVLVLALFLCATFGAFAQPVGATINNPVNLGTLVPGATLSDTKNNATSNGYQNNMGQLSDDIYYKFTLSSPAEVSISHCSSTFDTYMHLLDINGSVIDFKDDLSSLSACPKKITD